MTESVVKIQTCKKRPLWPWLSSYLFGLILVTVATISWSTAGLFTRIIALDSWTLLLWRGLFGGIAIAAFAILTERDGLLQQIKSLGKAGWMFVIISGVGMVFFITALKTTTVAHVSILYSVVPLLTAAIAWVAIGERPSRGAIVASVFSLLGVCIMVGLTTEGTWFGDLLAFGMTLCLAAMMIISRAVPDLPVLAAACLSAFVSAAIALPFSSPLSTQVDQWGWLIAFGVVNSALGLALFVVGSKRLPAIETALITAFDAPLAPLWVWLIFNEMPDVATLTGGSIVFIAVGYYLICSARRSYS